MYCTNCGHRYTLYGGFCPQCGALLADSLTGLDSTESRRPAYGVPWVPWGWIQVSLGILLVIALGLAVVSSLVSIFEVSPPQAAVLTSATLGLIVLAVVWVLGLRGQPDKLRLLGLTRVGWPGRWSVGWTLLVIVGSLAFSSIYVLTVRWLGLDVLLPPAHEKLVFSGPAVGLSFLALAMWTPLTEEIFFRAFVFGGLVQRWGVLGATVISALVFAFFHDLAIVILPFNPTLYSSTGAPGVLIPIFVTALLFAWLYRKTGSLWGPVAAHGVQNALVVAGVAAGV